MLILVFAFLGGLTGFAIRRRIQPNGSRLVAAVALVLPLAPLVLQGAAEGCLTSGAEACVGFGFMAFFVLFGVVPGWLLGLAFGYLAARSARTSE